MAEKPLKKVLGLLSVKEAADIAQVDSLTIFRWLWSRKLKGLRRGKRWVIPAHALRKVGKNRGE